MKILKLLLKIFEEKPKLKKVIDYGKDHPSIGDFIISISNDRGLIYGKKYEVTRLYYNNGAINELGHGVSDMNLFVYERDLLQYNRDKKLRKLGL
jgi:hypothetical protein